MASTRDIVVMRNAYQKLDTMVLSFGLPAYSESIEDDVIVKYFGLDLKDTLRELKLSNTDGIAEMSVDEMQIENRIVYHALKRFRNGSSVFFKFSTASDGKTIDKSMIPKMISNIIAEYGSDFSKWRRSGGGSMWTMTSTVATTGNIN
jgi:hypothetical protein